WCGSATAWRRASYGLAREEKDVAGQLAGRLPALHRRFPHRHFGYGACWGLNHTDGEGAAFLRPQWLNHVWTYVFVSCAPVGAEVRMGSSGMTIHTIGYASRPTPVITATINQTRRTMVTSRSNNSANTAQTPALFLSS